GDPRGDLVRAALADEGLELEQMKLKGFREMFFSRGERAVLCLPIGLSASTEADELHRGKLRWRLEFELPRGCYATLVVKRLTVCLAPPQAKPLAVPPAEVTTSPRLTRRPRTLRAVWVVAAGTVPGSLSARVRRASPVSANAGGSSQPERRA